MQKALHEAVEQQLTRHWCRVEGSDDLHDVIPVDAAGIDLRELHAVRRERAPPAEGASSRGGIEHRGGWWLAGGRVLVERRGEESRLAGGRVLVERRGEESRARLKLSHLQLKTRRAQRICLHTCHTRARAVDQSEQRTQQQQQHREQRPAGPQGACTRGGAPQGLDPLRAYCDGRPIWQRVEAE